jgi:hypothetical protein
MVSNGPAAGASGAGFGRRSFSARFGGFRCGQFFDKGVSNGRAIEDVPCGIGHFGEDAPDLASGLGGAIGTTPISDPAQAGQGSDWPVNDSEDSPEGDLIGGHQQPVAAEPAPAAGHNPVVLQVEEDLFEEFARDSLPVGDLRDHHRLVGAGKRHERPKSVSCLL